MWYAHAHTYIYTPSEHISNIIQHMDRASIHIMTSIQIMYYTHTHTLILMQFQRNMSSHTNAHLS